jgi:phycocyanobilin lyase beta subunit
MTSVMADTKSTGDPLVASLVEAVRRADSALGLLQATQALAAVGHPDGAACLVEVLGFNNPGAAVAAVDGLIAIGVPAVDTILANLDGFNYGARAWTVRALAGIGDVRGLDVLEDALGRDIGPSVRRAAARGLGQLNLEPLAAGERPPIAERCLRALVAGCSDGEWVVRYAVAVGLEALAPALIPALAPARAPGAPLIGNSANGEPVSRLLEALQGLSDNPAEEAPVVRLRARLALRRLLAVQQRQEGTDG